MIRLLLKLSVVAGTIAYTIYGAPSGARKRDATMWAVVIQCESREQAESVQTVAANDWPGLVVKAEVLAD